MRPFRVFLFVAAAIILSGAVLALLAGEYRFGVTSVLVGGSALLWATWAWAYPTAYPAREWICLGLAAAGFAVAGLWIVAIVGLLAVFLLNVAGSRFFLRRLSGIELQRVGPDEVMPRAKGTVAEFEAEGFQRVGGYRTRLPVIRKTVTAAVLVMPEGDRFAVVTDRVWEVVSRFGHRWLITTSSGITPLPPQILRQTIARARPAELVGAHQSALERLAAVGAEPDRLEEDGAIESGVALEAAAAHFMSDAPTKSFVGIEAAGKSDHPPLGEDELSRRRIDAWLYSSEPG